MFILHLISVQMSFVFFTITLRYLNSEQKLNQIHVKYAMRLQIRQPNKGTTVHMRIKPITAASSKKLISKRIFKSWKEEAYQQAKGKKWRKINELWDKNRYKPRKEAMAAIRLETGHDCLAAHLHRIKLYQTAECTICKDLGTTMDSDHLLHCTQLDSQLQERVIYWHFIGLRGIK